MAPIGALLAETVASKSLSKTITELCNKGNTERYETTASQPENDLDKVAESQTYIEHFDPL